MNDLTQDEINEIYVSATETFTEKDYVFSSLLVQYMMGYLRNPPLIEGEKIDDARQVFFRQIKRHLGGKKSLERDYEPEQAHGRADDFQRHVQHGGSREDY